MSETIHMHVHVSPGAARTAVVGRHGEGWKLRVAAAPERGRANDALVSFLAETLALPRSAVAVVAGHRARNKVVALAGIDAGELSRRLDLTTGEAPGATR